VRKSRLHRREESGIKEAKRGITLKRGKEVSAAGKGRVGNSIA